MRLQILAAAVISAAVVGVTSAPALAGDDRHPRFERHHGGHHAGSRHHRIRHYVAHRRAHRHSHRPAHRSGYRHVTVRHVYKYDHTPLYALGAVAAFVGLHHALTTPSYDPPPAPAYAPLPAPAYVPPRTGAAVTAEPYCREYTREVTVDGRPAQAYGQACRQPDGSWQIVSEN